MLPLYAVRIENLGQGEFVKVDCAACHHVALLTPGALFRVKMSPAAEVLDSRGGSGAAGADRAAVLPWRPAVRRVGATKCFVYSDWEALLPNRVITAVSGRLQKILANYATKFAA